MLDSPIYIEHRIHDDLNKMSKVIFSPPLATQRYCWVQDFISQNPNIRTLTDVGSSNGRMLIWLKNIPNLELVNCVDKDLQTIEDGLEYHFQPNLVEMLFGRKNSDKNLDIHIYHGDIAVPDDRLKADCFTMVELIEHINQDHLVQVCQTVFGYYRPNFIVVTTPNVEFNHLLQAFSQVNNDIVKTDNSQGTTCKFRHFDHKFEWTRAEFSHWADLMCKTYSYQVCLDGVGQLPGSTPYGFCTQIALFKRQDNGPTSQPAQPLTDSSLCIDLFLNKLSVQEEMPEFLGDPTLKKICLRAEYYVPGKRSSTTQESDATMW